MSGPSAGVITLRDLRSLGCSVEDAPKIERTASVHETVCTVPSITTSSYHRDATRTPQQNPHETHRTRRSSHHQP